MSTIRFSAAMDAGRLRANNEDSYLSLPRQGLWLVADGMGGHEAGEVASAVAVEAVRRTVADEQPLVTALREAHRAVLRAARDGVGVPGMGSTLVALQCRDDQYHVAWVGDSRAYLWDAGRAELRRLSTDHSYVQELVDSGTIDAAEADTHPERNIITQCIGSEDAQSVQVDSVQQQWKEAQWILLCSDGLSDELDDATMARILRDSTTSDEAVDQLLRAALERGGRDNITLQIVESPLGSAGPLMVLRRRLPRLVDGGRLDSGLYASAVIGLVLVCLWLLS